MNKKRKWEKVLYKDQGVGDNYVDESFLDELKKNLYTRTYDYWTAVRESGVVTQQLSSVCIFVVVFIYMEEKKLFPEQLFAVSSLVTLAGYIVNEIIDGHDKSNKRTRFDDLKTALLFIGLSFILSPVFVSLTETISTDTIYAMTTVMLFTSLLFHDYGAHAAVVSAPVSLDAAIFASICLASRLHTSLHAFSMVTFALEIFALWPVLRRKLKRKSPVLQYLLTWMMGITASLSLFSISAVGAIFFIFLHMFINFVCPAWLIKLQPLKNNIYGPWDEAVIRG